MSLLKIKKSIDAQLSELAAEFKKRQADCREKTTINLVDNFENDEDDDYPGPIVN